MTQSVAEAARARLAALQARHAGGAPAAVAATPAPTEAPVSPASPPPQEPNPAPSADIPDSSDTTEETNAGEETPTPDAPPADTVSERKGRGGRPKGSKNAPKQTPAQAQGTAGINPPEVTEALVALQTDPLHGSKGAQPALTVAGQGVVDGTPGLVTVALKPDAITLEQAAGLLAQLLPAGTAMTVQSRLGVGK